MASQFIVCVFLTLAAQGAVLDPQDTLLRRIARSPSCNRCSEHPHPPPVPPLPGSATSQARSFKEAEFSRNKHVGEFQKYTFNSEARASASAQAVSGVSGNHKNPGIGFQNNGFAGGSSASAQAVSSVSGGLNRHDSKLNPGNHKNLESEFQNSGFSAESSASAHAVSSVSGGLNRHDIKGNQGNHKHLGSGFQNNGFTAGSGASAQAVSDVGDGFNKQNNKGGNPKNHDSRSEYHQRGVDVGGVASAQASGSATGGYNLAHKDGNSGKQNFGVASQQNGQTVADAFKSQNQADKQGCSSCAKGGSAVSNAKSHSGTATAIAVNNG